MFHSHSGYSGVDIGRYHQPGSNGLTFDPQLQGDDPMVLLLGGGEHCPRERQHQRELVPFAQWCIVSFSQLVTVIPVAGPG